MTSEGERQAAFDGARGLGKIQHAAIAGNKGPVALRKQVPYIDQRLKAILEDSPAMDRLTQEKTQIRVVQIGFERIDSRERARLLPSI